MTFLAKCTSLSALICLAASAQDRSLPLPIDYVQMSQKHEPMDTGGLERAVKNPLADYYQQACGGLTKWQKVQSLRMEGVLHLADQALPFVAFKKKPAYTKIVLRGDDGPLMVMSYDGEDVWQLIPEASEEPSSMIPEEAANFIRDATFGTHLLYPTAAGKTIIYDGQGEVEGWICRNFTVELQNGDRIQYSLGIGNSLPRRQVVHNFFSGLTETTIHEEFDVLEGVHLPVRSSLWVEGEKIHDVVITDLEFNLGVMPWMFSRPSGAYIPGPSPKEDHDLIPIIKAETEEESPFQLLPFGGN